MTIVGGRVFYVAFGIIPVAAADVAARRLRIQPNRFIEVLHRPENVALLLKCNAAVAMGYRGIRSRFVARFDNGSTRRYPLTKGGRVGRAPTPVLRRRAAAGAAIRTTATIKATQVSRGRGPNGSMVLSIELPQPHAAVEGVV
jgi:hypothetical protein